MDPRKLVVDGDRAFVDAGALGRTAATAECVGSGALVSKRGILVFRSGSLAVDAFANLASACELRNTAMTRRPIDH